MKVRLSGDARAYLRREAAYLQKHSQKAAKAFVDRMTEARKNLTRFPEMGETFDRLPIPGSHRLVVGDYLLDYDLADEEVVILSIRHGQQQPLTPEIEDDFDYEDAAKPSDPQP
ncbi:MULTISPECIES: type II toxin-antitoxin system RelE/ParE family toxin [unclassified Mesorhizobium]|uniref:type II toxin-antitoxin system RelE/ParE family toxin n=1 Tax=unclassified Mesorhizobium TaxID=325217 RepID=UPI000FE7BB53|nr:MULTISPECIES: type II toxin-antitoxin system RelE/ParE family toxin [unclassified Mesorhizobium]RWB93767.1 MAG: type II toxin-antitoxin system RelE/ParE family toxin [Mesorhizobium sp.]TGV18175.1 type II toxin-antitoxin system RelE/ParE family toxin [Mesorhizobium sp. M4B.F.Ca.ET.143.01.1.1]